MKPEVFSCYHQVLEYNFTSMSKTSLDNLSNKIPDKPSGIKVYPDRADDSVNSLKINSPKKILDSSPFENKSDVEIWEIFKSGDEAAFIYVYSKYFNELINYGIQFTTDISLIEDCVQDLFIKLRKSRNKLGVIKKSIRLYLLISLRRRILDNKAIPKKRERVKNEFSKEFDIVLPLETHLIHEDILTERRKMLQKAMKQLTRKQREVIYYIYYKNLSYTEAREIMKINTNKTIRNLLYRALGSMRAVMKYLSVIILITIRFI